MTEPRRLSERIAAADAAARDGGGTDDAGAAAGSGAPQAYRGSGLGFRNRLTLGLVAAAVLPLAAFGIVVLLVTSTGDADSTVARVLLLGIAIAVVFAVLLGAAIASNLGAPLRAIASSVDRVSAGDLTTPLELPGDDEFSRLAESHNRLARDLERRNRELRRILLALESITLDQRPEAIAARAAREARDAFGMIECRILFVDPREIPIEELVPGDPVPVRAQLTAAGEVLGIAVGHLPATRRWERADQDLFELFAIEISAAIRNAQLYARVEDQNRRLVELDEAKDDFLRGVSHNLQTPLASIRGYAQQMEGETPDRRLGIITEQADRLSRMVRQLLIVSRIESGALRPRQEVFAPAARVRKTWEALGAADVPFHLDDASAGWLALADQDQLDQVLWAILDNAVHYGNRTGVDVTIRIEEPASRLAITIADHGPGVGDDDRERLFRRFERGAERPTGEGSGLGLYVSRELCRAMDGDLVLAPSAARASARPSRSTFRPRPPRSRRPGPRGYPWAGRTGRVPGLPNKTWPARTAARCPARWQPHRPTVPIASQLRRGKRRCLSSGPQGSMSACAHGADAGSISSPPSQRRRRQRGQSIVEFALLLPVFLLLLVTALDLGRLFFAYVSIENASKEAAQFGATAPKCDVAATGCADPNNVQWRVESEMGGTFPTADEHGDVPAAERDSSRLPGAVPGGGQLPRQVEYPFDVVTPVIRMMSARP